MTGDHTAYWIPGDYDTQEYEYQITPLTGIPINNGGDIPYKPPFFHWCIAFFSLIAGHVNEYTSFPLCCFLPL